MTSQQALFADTIIAMKKAMKRRAYDSEDSEDEINYRGNRGQKLKKRARYAREGQLAPPSGPEVYKEYVSHAGYTRAIISRNPPLVDGEGYEPESDDEDYEQRMQEIAETAAEFNPYASVRLENILAPLAAVTELPTHATLSRPYTSKILTDLTIQARDIMQKENIALWKVKHLHTKLVGDHIWAPTELMETANDITLYQEEQVINSGSRRSVNTSTSIPLLENGPAGGSTNGQPSLNGDASLVDSVDKEALTEGDTSLVDADATLDEDAILESEPRSSTSKGTAGEAPEKDKEADDSSRTAASDGNNDVSGESHKVEKRLNDTRDLIQTNGQSDTHAEQSVVGDELSSRHHDPDSLLDTTTIEDLDKPFIHPIFLAPRMAHPNRDMGLPETEAENLRRLLQLYVQKQEEVCRGAKRLNEGLLRADRLRKTVLQWSKFEAHVGPNRDMSDGEDWYDKEEWGLEEDLKKGQDEEEEDTTQTAKKTTRARR